MPSRRGSASAWEGRRTLRPGLSDENLAGNVQPAISLQRSHLAQSRTPPVQAVERLALRACAAVLGLEQNPREGRAFGGFQATLDEERRGDLSCFVVTSPLTAAHQPRRGGRREAST